jgi:hypothetical protein
MAAPEPLPPPEIIERVLEKLGIHERPSVDLAGLNAVYAAWCGNIQVNARRR